MSVAICLSQFGSERIWIKMKKSWTMYQGCLLVYTHSITWGSVVYIADFYLSTSHFTIMRPRTVFKWQHIIYLWRFNISTPCFRHFMNLYNSKRPTLIDSFRHLKVKSRLPVTWLFLSCHIVSKFCTGHGNIISVPCAAFQSNSTSQMSVMEKPGFRSESSRNLVSSEISRALERCPILQHYLMDW